MRNFNANIRLIHKSAKCNSKNEGNQHKDTKNRHLRLRGLIISEKLPLTYKA